MNIIRPFYNLLINWWKLVETTEFNHPREGNFPFKEDLGIKVQRSFMIKFSLTDTYCY